MMSLMGTPWLVCLMVCVFLITGNSASISTPFDLLFPSGGRLGKESTNSNCFACGLALYTIIEYADEHEATIEEGPREACEIAVVAFGETVLQSLEKHGSIEKACTDMRFCTRKAGECPVPGIRPKIKTGLSEDSKTDTLYVPSDSELLKLSQHMHNVNSPMDWIKDLLAKIEDKKPFEDLDQDKFSAYTELRGSHWRGRDCHEENHNIYPGRLAGDDEHTFDHNCNGIKGTNPDTKNTYEEELCGEYPPMTTVVSGDSAGAHFSVDPAWVSPRQWNRHTFSNLYERIADELDLPHFGFFTGYEESTPERPVQSLYLQMREHNLCNHRQYQNICVNGARSDNNHDDIRYLASDSQNDAPMLLIYELIGNDVCHADSLDEIITPPDFYNNTMERLRYFDSVMPKGSHIAMIGVLQEAFHYDILHNETHPLGFEYGELYEYMNCLKVSPCWPWMNKDKATRDEASRRASLLNKEYERIAKEEKFENFDLIFFLSPLKHLMDTAVSRGFRLADTLDPVDGFHPSQLLNSISGEWMWEALMDARPEWLGPKNPNNDKIRRIFKDQGGH